MWVVFTFLFVGIFVRIVKNWKLNYWWPNSILMINIISEWRHKSSLVPRFCFSLEWTFEGGICGALIGSQLWGLTSLSFWTIQQISKGAFLIHYGVSFWGGKQSYVLYLFIILCRISKRIIRQNELKETYCYGGARLLEQKKS